ncbi:MAG: hypothetical protein GXP54_03710 [Deltaproteobacteria bacterium]|nr:hypothetical protein [Deltaproteobacteria bacterium]
MMMALALTQTVLQSIGGLDVSDAARQAQFDRVTADSREVGQGVAFVAVRGSRIDGPSFINSAIEAGTALIVAEKVPDNRAAPWVGSRIPDWPCPFWPRCARVIRPAKSF